MARPQVVDGEDLQIWRVAENKPNKLSRTTDMGGPPAWGSAGDCNSPHRKNPACYEMLHGASGVHSWER
jgi:hypothetical protein